MSDGKRDPERFVRKQEARELAGGISNTTLARWEEERGFPRRKYLSKNNPIWKAKDILSWVEENAREAVQS